MLKPKPMLHELVKLVHVDVGEELRGKIPQRQTFSLLDVETLHNRTEEINDQLVVQPLVENMNQRYVVDAGKKFTNITFKHPDSSPMVV